MPLEDRPEPSAGPGAASSSRSARPGSAARTSTASPGSTGRRRVGVGDGPRAAGDVVDGRPRASVGCERRPGRTSARSCPCGRATVAATASRTSASIRQGLGMQFDGALRRAGRRSRALLADRSRHACRSRTPRSSSRSRSPDARRGRSRRSSLGGLGRDRRRGRDRAADAPRRPPAPGPGLDHRHRPRPAPARRARGARRGPDVSTSPTGGSGREPSLAATDGRGADVVLGRSGLPPTVAQSIAVARPGGRVTWIGNSAPEVRCRCSSS